MPQNVLKNMKWWFVDSDTGEAIMEDQNEQCLLRVYDSLHLVNLSKDDLMMLHQNKIFYIDAWRHEGRRYQKVVSVCVSKGLYAGSVLYR